MPKKAQKGLKSQKGQPEYYDELKKRVMVMLTPTAVERLDILANSMDLSRSELIEQFARGTSRLPTAAEVQRLGESLPIPKSS